MTKIKLLSKLLFLSLTYVSFFSTTSSAGPSTHKHSSKNHMKEHMETLKARHLPYTVKNPQPGEVIVKCAGIAAKGKNHCGANGHVCGGKAAKDFDKNEWIYVRKEVCDATPGRIVGKVRIVK